KLCMAFAIRLAVASERSSSRFTPAREGVALHSRGIPLVLDPNEKKSTRALSGTLRTAGTVASFAFSPAPEWEMPAAFRVCNVSDNPSYPQSKLWLFARAQALMRAAERQPTFCGCMR